MAEPVLVTETFTSSHSPADAQARLAAHFGRKVRQNEPGLLVARTGSKFAIRMLGAYLMPRGWMPAKVTAQFTPSDGGCEVAVTCTDDFGFGFRTGMRGRYEQVLTDLMAETRGALETLPTNP